MIRLMRRFRRIVLTVILLILAFLVLFDIFKNKQNSHNEEIKMQLIEDEILLRKDELKNAQKDVNLIDERSVKNVWEKGSLDQNESNSQPVDCPRRLSQPDIQMLDVYEKLPFKNLEGGEWTQGWQIKYEADSFNDNNKLKVFVVPHSHNDPGWLRTFDNYYEHTTRFILYNMLRFLDANPDMKFIWAEISFFSRWYEMLNTFEKDVLRSILDRKQLEFVSGGWVMPDEANSHWLGITIQLIEGQNWLKKHLNVLPKTGWAIDPFGHSPTLPYLLKHAKIEDTLIQRTHYEVKKNLAESKNLEFYWRQLFDDSGSTDLFTHMMPFLSYSAPYSCGPDPKVCCQFDFERLPEKGRTCKWGIQPEEITYDNLVEKATLLLDQWRKKSVLYRTQSLLIPLGDDFRYGRSVEWQDQYENYKKLFNYLNNNKDLYVEVKFASLQEYFESVHREHRQFPILTGDFFTYSDRDDHYWSGYYTSRPYYKRMDRVLLHYLRSAEMLYSWNRWESSNQWLERRLRNATQALSLFQHHDGITGTAREHVVQDYARMLNFAIKSCKFVMQQAAYRLMTEPQAYKPDFKKTYFQMDESQWPGPDDDIRPVIMLTEKHPVKYVVLHNSLPQWRDELVEFHVSTPFIEVYESESHPVRAQISPVWSWHSLFHNVINPKADTSKFSLHFRARIPPLGLTKFTIRKSSLENASRYTTYAKITVLAEVPFFLSLGTYPIGVSYSKPQTFNTRSNGNMSASFNQFGILKSISGKNNFPKMPIHLEFLKYGTRMWFDQSGAYLFMPDGPAKPTPFNHPTVIISEGELETSVSTGLAFVIHRTILRDESVEIRNLIDIGKMGNTEIVMRMTTNINSTDTFYTDLNGLQIIKRKYLTKLPLQANYYPVPSSIYIEDDRTRLTVLSAQPLGGSSLISGQIDLMQDRRLNQGDGRGLGEGVLDNRPVMNIFKILLEDRSKCNDQSTLNRTDGSLTMRSYKELQRMLHPIDKFIWDEEKWPGSKETYGANHKALKDDFEIPFLRRTPDVYRDDGVTKGELGLIVHRTKVSCRNFYGIRDGNVDIKQALSFGKKIKIFSSPITFVTRDKLIVNNTINFCPMDIKAFIIEWN